VSDPQITAAVIGGLFTLAAAFVTYRATRRPGERRRRRMEETLDNQRKKKLTELLADDRFPTGRYLETLRVKTGTDEAECRRLLGEIGAEGMRLKDGEGFRLKRQ
jgi:hypothetical protein